MSTDAPGSHRPKTIFWLLAAFIVTPILFLLVWWSVQNRAVGTIQAGIASKHEPLTAAELAAKYPPIPDEQNAAIALLDVWEREQGEYWAQFRRGEKPTASRPSETAGLAQEVTASLLATLHPGSSLDPVVLAAGDSQIEQIRPHLDAVHTALSREQGQFPLRFADGPNMLLPHLSQLKREAIQFQIQALLASEHGDPTTAIRALADGAKVGGLLKTEPFLISQLVRLSVTRTELNSLERLLSKQALSPPQLQELQEILRHIDLNGDLRQALIGERVLVFEQLNSENPLQALDLSSDSAAGQWGVRIMSATGILASDRRLLLSTFTKAITLLEHESPTTFAEFDRLVDEAAAAARRFPPKIFSRMLLPAFSKVAIRFGSAEASLRAARTAVAVELFRSARGGKLPDKLEELENFAVPIDPFDGRPLRFQRQPTGYVIYSVGPNQVDDGGAGVTGTGSSSRAALDEVFTVER